MPPEFHIGAIRLETNGFGVVALIFVVLGIIFSMWYYRNTVPAVEGWRKWLLTGLRATALILLFFMLAQPVLNYVSTISRSTRTVILLDTSSSMNQNQDPGRKEQALSILGKIRSEAGERGMYYGFDSAVHPLSKGEPPFDGSGTDIHTALADASGRDLISAVILVSDGRWNLGEDPAVEALKNTIPVHTVTVGSLPAGAEVSITRLLSPPVVQDGESATVEASITSSRTSSETVPVEITENGAVVARTDANFNAGSSVDVRFDIPVTGAGEHHYTLTIHPSEDENSSNNTRSLVIRAEKQGYRILILADKPSPDFSFLTRALDAGGTVRYDAVIGEGISDSLRGVFPGTLSDFDAVILLNWGGSAIPADGYKRLKEWTDLGGGILAIGSSLIPDRARVFTDALPMEAQGQTVSGKFYLRLSPEGMLHYITSGDGTREKVWEELPPVPSVLPIAPSRGKGTVLAWARQQSDNLPVVPAVVAGACGSGKALIVPLSGIWRWKLMMEGAGKNGMFYDGFIQDAVAWLASSTDKPPLTISTDKTTYLSGEEVRFEARLYNPVFSPVTGAEIILEFDGGSSMKAMLKESRPSFYTGSIRGLSSGNHAFKVKARRNGNLYAESTGSVAVEAFPLEMLDPSPNPGLMKRIAERTGGIAVSPAGLDSILARISPQNVSERHANSIAFAVNPIMLALILACVILELSIRKSLGML